MTVTVRDHSGAFDIYMGAGMMAFFGDAGRHETSAVRASLTMQKQMAEPSANWMGEGQELHLFRIRINTGELTLGNLGAKYLWAYTVIGAEVNKAQLTKTLSLPATS